jgi:hypothetical protein
MKSKASLLLMEQLVMVLVFALAAALCLQVFVKAKEISEETARQDQAVILARNGAELLKATHGDVSAAEALAQNGYQMTVRLPQSQQPGLSRAEIDVSFGEELLFSLETGWQEVLQ